MPPPARAACTCEAGSGRRRGALLRSAGAIESRILNDHHLTVPGKAHVHFQCIGALDPRGRV
jgi:hypothetical protein